MQRFDAIVIGEGVAGLTAANQLARSGVRVATFEANIFGGLVLNVNELHPSLDDDAPQSGSELSASLFESNAELGIESVQEPVTEIAVVADGFTVTTNAGTYGARQVIVATGARLRALGIPGETEFEGQGVSHCADCDGALFRNEDVVVVGGGDSALQEALVVAEYSRTVHLVHHGAELSARADFVERVLAHPGIRRIPNATLEAIEGDRGVRAVRIRAAGEDEPRRLECAGVFPFIGLAPNSELMPEAAPRDERGALVTDAAGETPVRGLWAAGAVRHGCGGMIADAVEDARRAAAGVRARLR